MGKKKLSLEVIGGIRKLLDLKWSLPLIQSHLKKKNIHISIGHLSNIKNNKEKISTPKEEQKKRGRKSKVTKPILARLKRMADSTDPPTQKDMAKRLGVTKDCVRYNIKNKLDKKLVNKPKGNYINETMIEKRRIRSWPLYLRLRKDRWKKVITTDEAWFYLTNKKGKRNVQYISRQENRSQCEHYTKESHPKGIMVWAGISANGKTSIRFVKPGAKINSDYYQKSILGPFLRRDVKRLYPDGNYLFHQDSAPSHRSKSTCDYLKKHKVPFIRPDQWMPNCPECAPCDYFLWGYLKVILNKLKINTISGLNNAILREFKKIPQDMINRALKAWPKRCREIYYNKGLNIEKHN